MDGEEIPATVKALIANYIQTLMGLESLLLLHKDRARGWTAVEVANELRVDFKWVANELEAFCRKGLFSVQRQTPPRYFYAPVSRELESAVDALVTIYAQRRVTVIQLIFSKPIDPIKTFADAFDFRKGKSDG